MKANRVALVSRLGRGAIRSLRRTFGEAQDAAAVAIVRDVVGCSASCRRCIAAVCMRARGRGCVQVEDGRRVRFPWLSLPAAPASPVEVCKVGVFGERLVWSQGR